MPELRVAAVIFDMDGVVIDSGDIYAKHWRLWGDQHGIDYTTRIAAVHPGRPPVETIRLVAPGLDAEAESRVFNDALGADDGFAIAAMPGARELLESLPQGRWAIATSAFRDIAEGWLEAAGLPRPAALVTVDDIEHGKPAPDPYLLAAKQLGVDPARCVVVEDSPGGRPGGQERRRARARPAHHPRGCGAHLGRLRHRGTADHHRRHRWRGHRDQLGASVGLISGGDHLRYSRATSRLRKRPAPACPFHSPSSTMTFPRESTTSLPPWTSMPS